jgi:hypothetical protein
MERMARRRHQNPKPIREGLWWYLRVWEYSFVDGKQVRKLKRIKLAEASKKEREVKKIADEIVRPINHGQITVGGAVNFGEYVKDNGTYMTAALSLRPKAVMKCYKGVINKYLNPAFENTSLAEISLLRTQAFFAELPGRGIAYQTIEKIRDAVLACVALGSEVPVPHGKPDEGAGAARGPARSHRKTFHLSPPVRGSARTHPRALRDHGLCGSVDGAKSLGVGRLKVAQH